MDDADNPLGRYFVLCEALEQLLIPNILTGRLQTTRNGTHLRLKRLTEFISVTGCKKIAKFICIYSYNKNHNYSPWYIMYTDIFGEQKNKFGELGCNSYWQTF